MASYGKAWYSQNWCQSFEDGVNDKRPKTVSRKREKKLENVEKKAFMGERISNDPLLSFHPNTLIPSCSISNSGALSTKLTPPPFCSPFLWLTQLLTHTHTLHQHFLIIVVVGTKEERRNRMHRRERALLWRWEVNQLCSLFLCFYCEHLGNSIREAPSTLLWMLKRADQKLEKLPKIRESVEEEKREMKGTGSGRQAKNRSRGSNNWNLELKTWCMNVAGGSHAERALVRGKKRKREQWNIYEWRKDSIWWVKGKRFSR